MVEGRDFCVWLTGLPASGKTTLALALERHLKAHGLRPVVLDGDDLRQFLWPELRFSREARKAQAERATYLAKLIQKAGGIPIVHFPKGLHGLCDLGKDRCGGVVVKIKSVFHLYPVERQ